MGGGRKSGVRGRWMLVAISAFLMARFALVHRRSHRAARLSVDETRRQHSRA